MKALRLFIFALLLTGCQKEKWFDGPDNISEDFESYFTADSLFPSDKSRWSYHQSTLNGNYIRIDTSIVHQGGRSLRMWGDGTSGTLSKSSIVKQHMAFYEGEKVYISAWYYLEEAPRDQWLFLFDFEEQAAIGAGPGIRIAETPDKGLVIEHKYFEDDHYQESPEVHLGTNEWVRLEVEIFLSQKNKGYVKLWRNGQLIIEEYNTKTLPKDFLYSTQGTKGMYTSVEFGITANACSAPQSLYLDDIEVHVLR